MTRAYPHNKEALREERAKETHFHPRQAEFNLRDAWLEWNGYKFAQYYYDASYEYFCIRNTCGTYDICPMQKYEISGVDAEAMLNRMVTRDISKLKEGRITYTVWCTDAGRVIDDGTVFRLGQDKFMLSCGAPMLAWLKKASIGYENLTIVDKSDTLAGLALQGPTSCEVLKQMGLDGIETLKPFGFMNFDFEGANMMVSRTGFTGDLGYELWIDGEKALKMWDALYAAGENYGIHPYGETATDMARIEAGFIMPLVDFNEALHTVHFQHDQTPFELNLGWLVDFKKPHFNGRKALLREKQDGSEYVLTKLDIEGNRPAVEAYLYADKGCTKHIGYVTSALWSPAVKANIALAMIKPEALKGDIYAEIYFAKETRQYMKVAKCAVQDKPFWAPARARATPPAAF